VATVNNLKATTAVHSRAMVALNKAMEANNKDTVVPSKDMEANSKATAARNKATTLVLKAHLRCHLHGVQSGMTVTTDGCS